MINWFAARTIVGREAKVAARLTRFETFLPISLEPYYLFGKRKDRLSPLFPGYFFLRCDPELRPTRRDDFWGLLGAEGTGIGEPLSLADAIIDELRGRLNQEGVIVLPQFEIGDTVQVTDGPLVDRVGLYQGQSTPERAVILLTILGRDCHVPIDSLWLKAVEIHQ